MIQFAFTAFVATLLLAGTAVAQDSPPPLTQEHQDYVDTSDDGSVSRQELGAVVRQAFSALDANKDGSLDSAELEQVLTSAQFSALDENGDGRVSQAELMQQAANDFAEADHDRDGQLK